MGQHRLIALAAILNLDGFQMLMAAPLPLPGMRRSPLGNCHEFLQGPISKFQFPIGL
jgi:hypothetical protein